ncbi:MAG: hypothetical protein E7272_05790 [Pseudobutyrivibrio ruminis]|uniref:Uncharacterized protein n=1 Tax=Pseudobutyrivibrio ruminis TaxID=46206 RepID=A0A927U914_9FIRM|nr:hypothetical protein [Pseudobutyrivibrio ruminis]
MPVFDNEKIKKIISLEKLLTENIGARGDKPIETADLQVSLIQIYSYTDDKDWDETVQSLSTEEEKNAFNNIVKFQSILENTLKKKSDASQKQYQQIRKKVNDPMEIALELKAIDDEILRYENREVPDAIPHNDITKISYFDAKNRKKYIENLKRIVDSDSYVQLEFSNTKYDELNKEEKLYILEADFSSIVDMITSDVEKELNMAILKESDKKEALIKGKERKYTKKIDSIILEDEYKKASKDEKPLIMARRKEEIYAEMNADKELKAAKLKLENEWANKVNILVIQAEIKAMTVFTKTVEQTIEKRKERLKEHAEKNYFQAKPKVKSALSSRSRRKPKTDAKVVINDIEPKVEVKVEGNDIKPEKQAEAVKPKEKEKIVSLLDERIKNEKELLKKIEKMNQDELNTKYSKKQKARVGARLTTNMAKGGFVGDKGTSYVIDLNESKFIKTNLAAYARIYGRELAACVSTFYQDKKDFRIAQDNHFARLKAIHNILAGNKKFGFTSNSTEYTRLLDTLTDFEKKCKDNGWDKLLDPDKQDISKLTHEEIIGRRDMYRALHDVYEAACDYMKAKGPGAKSFSHGEKRYELAYLLCNEIYNFGGHAAECESRISQISKDIKNHKTELNNSTKQIANQGNARAELSKKYEKDIDAELKKMGIEVNMDKPENFIDNNIKNKNSNMIV